ncbi:GNAT family N-acetyltransferase [Rossellomorea aquimaris]|uniref:GNAT family N-acetyltransferase n=1 Tax=Rossellomorea aquimaris TaxID=189382 RepID=UPI001CD6BA9A|nr:GNAT family N-acetyltransferase [Rossellomorea aquimaris]MCA1053713.1 GNAT family N-acetyltransferase [Rossellomorea aquimaris]
MIKELTTESDWLAAYPVMKQLRNHLSQDQFIAIVKEATVSEGYKLAALYEEGRLVSVVGFMPMVTLYNGKFIWVCDLVTASDARSKGHGKKLLSHVESWANENGYPVISLSSGLQRADAHRFYEEKMDYRKKSYVFLKEL